MLYGMSLHNVVLREQRCEKVTSMHVHEQGAFRAYLLYSIPIFLLCVYSDDLHVPANFGVSHHDVRGARA